MYSWEHPILPHSQQEPDHQGTGGAHTSSNGLHLAYPMVVARDWGSTAKLIQLAQRMDKPLGDPSLAEPGLEELFPCSHQDFLDHNPDHINISSKSGERPSPARRNAPEKWSGCSVILNLLQRK